MLLTTLELPKHNFRNCLSIINVPQELNTILGALHYEKPFIYINHHYFSLECQYSSLICMIIKISPICFIIRIILICIVTKLFLRILMARYFFSIFYLLYFSFCISKSLASNYPIHQVRDNRTIYLILNQNPYYRI